MKFSDYIQKQGDEFRKAGDGYEALSDTSKACIDYAVQRFVDEYAAKQQCIAYFNYLKRYAAYGDNTEEMLYELFIEQQNKDNDTMGVQGCQV